MATWKKVLLEDQNISVTNITTDGTVSASGLSDITSSLTGSNHPSVELIVLDSGELKTITADFNTGAFSAATDGPLTTEQVQDIVGAMFSSNTETRISATYQDGDGTIDLVVDDMTADTDTQLTAEAVQDIVGAMFSSNTETRIAATYDDTDGTIDLVVDDMSADTQPLTTEEVQDIVGAMFSSNTETRIAATYQDGDGTIDLVVDDMSADTQLTAEAVQDIVGAMFSSNTETRIAVTYDDTDGTIDLVVDDMTDAGTDVDVSVANLITRMGQISGSQTLNIGDSGDDTTVVVRGNLTVNGTTTTLDAATLVVEDKNIRLGDPTTAYGSDALAVAGATGGGIHIVSDTSSSEADYASILWDNVQLTGWSLLDASSVAETATNKHPIAIMDFGTPTPVSATDGTETKGAGIGSFYFETDAKDLFIRVD